MKFKLRFTHIISLQQILNSVIGKLAMLVIKEIDQQIILFLKINVLQRQRYLPPYM